MIGGRFMGRRRGGITVKARVRVTVKVTVKARVRVRLGGRIKGGVSHMAVSIACESGGERERNQVALYDEGG